MKNYRLKKEAVQFFQEKFATSVYSWDVWNKNGVDDKALEEVEPMHITYGIKTSKSGSSLSGWDNSGTHFHFTINFPSVKYEEHDKFSNGKVVRGLMDKIQSQVDRFYNDFTKEESSE